VALITLIVPPMSLYLGFLVNHEALHESVIGGTAMIMVALLLNMNGTGDVRRKRQPSATR